MAPKNARFMYHTVGIVSLGNLPLLAEAIYDVAAGAKLVSAEEDGELQVGMDLMDLGEVRRFRIQCSFSPIGPDDKHGLCVRITPKGDKEMTVDEVRQLEKRVLVPRLLALPQLTVMPYSRNGSTMSFMKNNLREDKNWSRNVE